MECDKTPIEKWTVSEVSSWLKTINVKEEYISKLHDEEVDGQVLLELTEDFLKKETRMKSGPALLILKKRDTLVQAYEANKKRKAQQKQYLGSAKEAQTQQLITHQKAQFKTGTVSAETEEKPNSRVIGSVVHTKRDCKPRPFGTDGLDSKYVKHNVLQPESGVFDLISPCHEYKSLSKAVKLDRTRLQAKFAREVLKFGIGCMNIRSNGTIHFGVMDSKEDHDYVHGEIIGIPVTEKDIYVDALDHIERSMSSDHDREHVRQCIRPPQFIEVVGVDSEEKVYVVEVDIVPDISIVKNQVYEVQLPNFNEKANKVQFEDKRIYRRAGANTENVSNQIEFCQRVRERDVQREKAEHSHFNSCPEVSKDLGRKLTMLVTSGKKTIEKEKWHILVTNKFQKPDLECIDFLLNLKIFCVFDFDPDSKQSGFCSKYLQHHAANLHFMQNYRIPSGMTGSDFEKQLQLFDQTSWIFCNGRNDYCGNETPCDEMTWIKTKTTLLRECISLICNEILPKGTFLVIFLLTSPVEKPLLHTFCEFFTDMEGHEDIICISESKENYQRWKSFAEGYCDPVALESSSIVGMKMSHVNTTLQRIQPLRGHATKHLPVFTKGECLLKTRDEEQMYSLEILGINQCEETSDDFIEAEKKQIEQQFYHGGKVTWLHFWLAEKQFIGEVIRRDAYSEISQLLITKGKDQMLVSKINVYHHPGSGGSTVARQVLWNNRRDLRCAVVKPSNVVTVVSEHAVKLREYEEMDRQRCLPVLLLVEDCEGEFLEDLAGELEIAMHTKKILQRTLCFILLSCRRSHDPEKLCKQSPLQNVAVTHMLSSQEKRQFAGKLKKLTQEYQPQFILTFVLMSEGFKQKYITDFVKHLFQEIDHKSLLTRLIQYVALLNTYVQNSFISQSHCEALLSLTIHMDRFRTQAFEGALTEQAKLVFIHLRDDKTYIKSVRIIHPLVAKEILRQLLSNDQRQSDLAINLLKEDVLFDHRFGHEEYAKFLRDLFMRRCRISKGDESDSFFSLLIEHVQKHESADRAIELLVAAYTRFNKDAFFAQQLARLNYCSDRFEQAEHWAEIAVKKMPNNSYVLDTHGQVYRRWFNAKCKTIEKVTPQNTANAIETALTAMECFRKCEDAAMIEMENVNNSGFFASVEVGCSLLKLIFSLEAFQTKRGKLECLKYLVTDFIPEAVRVPWEPLHSKLKNLRENMQKALEWISEDLCYFQNDLEEEEGAQSSEMKINNAKHWLVSKSSVYGKYFSEASLIEMGANLSPFMKRMRIYHLGGGNLNAIFSLLTDQKEKEQIQVLENIISLYPSDPETAKLDQMDLANYIATQFALGCLSSKSQKLVPLPKLCRLCQSFPQDHRKCLPSALFLLTLLFWPDDEDTKNDREKNYDIVMSATESLKGRYLNKMKDVPQRRRRVFTHFFLGNGSGWNKIIHKSKVETITKFFSVSEKRMKWLSGEVWKMPEIAGMLRSVHGWTEDGTVFLRGPQKKKFMIPALNMASVPYSNENVKFYLGFTFRGPVAYNITVI